MQSSSICFDHGMPNTLLQGSTGVVSDYTDCNDTV